MTTIKWIAFNSSGSEGLLISIYYSNDLGETWDLIVSDIENTGAYDFDTTTFSEGIYVLRIDAYDSQGEIGLGFSGLISLSQPPEKPERPSGPARIETDKIYFYTTSAVDPEGGQLYYLWDWGDESYSELMGPYEPGEIAEANHTWKNEVVKPAGKQFEIRVLAVDSCGVAGN